MTSYAPMAAAHDPGGHIVRWATWDGGHLDTTTVRWENEGYTVSGVAERERVEYVVRLSATWQVRQFILFRDLEEPDLWLATDGSGRWGEMNGAHRTELDGCYDLDLSCTPFTNTIPIHRLPLLEGHAAELPVVHVDTETLEVRPVAQRYTRLTRDARRHDTWRYDNLDTGYSVDLEVDEHGLVLDYPGEFRRLS
jgi:uncharacterized protein